MRPHTTVLELLQMVKHFAPVEHLDVVRLRRGETTDRPTQVHEVWLDGVRQRMHADLIGQAVSLARVAGTARRDDVRRLIRSTARQRDQVVA
jgi:hypothetical protein